MKLLLDNSVIQSWAIVGGFIPSEEQMVVEVDDIPLEVQNDIPQKWCYTVADGYFLNPDYQPEPEPEPIDEKIAALEEQNQMLIDCILEMSEIVYGGDF